VKGLKQGLQELGWIDRRNVQMEYPWLGGEPNRIQASAKALVGARAQCEVIVARSTPVVAALLRETHTIPIVFGWVVDPRRRRLRAKLSTPRRQCDRAFKIWNFRWSASG
jgi:putative ABC transport system substrate-binding protein